MARSSKCTRPVHGKPKHCCSITEGPPLRQNKVLEKKRQYETNEKN